MSTSHRNPKELRSLIQSSQVAETTFLDDIEMFDDAFLNLRHIPSEDKTELGMMKNRIDEQSRLIMVLKKSGDDYLNKNSVLEKMNQQLNQQIEELENTVKDLNNKQKLINDRFKTLSDYNEEIIKYKDEYKSKNVTLTAELDELKKSISNSAEAVRFAALKAEMESKIASLTEKCDQHDKTIELINAKNERIRANINASHEENIQKINLEWEKKQTMKESEIRLLNSKINSNDSENLKYKSEIESRKKEIADLLNKLNAKDSQHEVKMKEMESLMAKERSDFDKKSSQFSVNINSITKEKLHYASQVKKLTEDNKFLSDRCSSLDVRVEELERELNESSIVELKRRNAELKQEFDNFKSYSNVLIEKERDLNEKLRFLVS